MMRPRRVKEGAGKVWQLLLSYGSRVLPESILVGTISHLICSYALGVVHVNH